MRIAVSGTHCSGKSTLIEDFLAAHRDYAHEPEPYEWLEAAYAEPNAEDFFAQLEMSIERWRTHAPGARVIGERCPLDFIAYLRALGENVDLDAAGDALEHIDLLVVVSPDDVPSPDGEHPDLRAAMHEELLELVLESGVRMLEIHGSRRARLDAVRRIVSGKKEIVP